MITPLLIAFAVAGYVVDCSPSKCRVSSRFLRLDITKGRDATIVQPVLLISDPAAGGAPKRFQGQPRAFATTSLHVTPDFCDRDPQQCGYLFDGTDHVTAWAADQPTAWTMSTAVALSQLKRARSLKLEAHDVSGDSIMIYYRRVSAKAVLEAVRRAEQQLAATKIQR